MRHNGALPRSNRHAQRYMREDMSATTGTQDRNQSHPCVFSGVSCSTSLESPNYVQWFPRPIFQFQFSRRWNGFQLTSRISTFWEYVSDSVSLPVPGSAYTLKSFRYCPVASTLKTCRSKRKQRWTSRDTTIWHNNSSVNDHHWLPTKKRRVSTSTA